MSDFDSTTDIGADEGFEDVVQEMNDRRLAQIQRRVKAAASTLDGVPGLPIHLRGLPADTARMHLEMAARDLATYIASLP